LERTNSPFPPSPDATRASSTHHPALRSRSRRQLWLTIHLYLGLAAGLVFVIAGVTGTAIAFGEDLDAWLNADLMTVVAPTEGLRARRPVDELFEAARSTMPADASPMYLRLPREPERAVSLSYGTTSAAFPEDMDHFEVFVDPYTGQVIGQRVQNIAGAPFSGPLMGLLVELHYNLLIGPLGAVLVGIVAAFLMVSLVTGLILWWPRTGKWAQALTIKRNASAERLNFDLHKTFGAVTSPLFLIILLSGVYMNLPEYVRPVVDLFSPASGWPEGVESGPAAGRVAMRPGQALAASETVFADGELMGIELPDGPQGAYAIRRRAPDEVTQAYPHRQVWIDQYSGAILAINDPHRYTAGQKFLEWQFPLHSGEAFGLPGRITVLILGLVPPLLYATGFIRWLQKRRAASRKRELTAPERTRAR